MVSGFLTAAEAVNIHRTVQNTVDMGKPED